MPRRRSPEEPLRDYVSLAETRAAWLDDAKGTSKFVLLALARYCSDGRTFTGLGTIGKMTGLSKPTVCKAIRLLLAKGSIQAVGRDRSGTKVYCIAGVKELNHPPKREVKFRREAVKFPSKAVKRLYPNIPLEENLKEGSSTTKSTTEVASTHISKLLQLTAAGRKAGAA